ncbi:hypothetical protein MNB_SV-14-1827 [hydrothermal vent metagenome]|uniref:Uncharacterized protein n=1 Tax=hydrothermal vent metagenome TaxID=652676 RepID=A0A1W1BZE8_9ZZZZ
MFEKKRVTVAIAIAVLSTLIAYATEKIDLDNYRVKIVKNASKKDIQSATESIKFEFGKDIEKIITKVDFDCKSLGLSKTNEFKNPPMGYVEYTYKKEIEKDVEALCEEMVYNSGSESVAFLIKW